MILKIDLADREWVCEALIEAAHRADLDALAEAHRRGRPAVNVRSRKADRLRAVADQLREREPIS